MQEGVFKTQRHFFPAVCGEAAFCLERWDGTGAELQRVKRGGGRALQGVAPKQRQGLQKLWD